MSIKNSLKQVVAIILGMLTVLKHCFKKRVTLEYPEKRPDINMNFRGKHQFSFGKCIACELCKRVCPVGAISMAKDKVETGGFVLKSYSIDYKKCIFCGNCYNYCPSMAITSGKEFELACCDKEDLIQKWSGKNE